MNFYRCYSINEAGKVLDLNNFMALGDAEAIEASALFHARERCHSVELWEEGRRVVIPTSPG